MHDGHPWQVRIPDPEDPAETLGSGVLVGPRHLITCARVVAAALRIPVGAERPRGTVALELPLLPEPIRGRGRVAAWVPEAGLDPRWTPAGTAAPGLAVLELAEALPAAVLPARLELLAPADYRERAVFCMGFPPDAPEGRRVHADCADAEADSITGLKTDHGVIDRSFTGTGAWDPIRGSLLGLVVADEFPGPTALLIPAQVLLEAWPEAPVRTDHGARERLLRWVAGLDTRRGNLLLRILAGLAFLGLGALWWLEPDTPPALQETEAPAAATSRISGFVWQPTGQPIPGVRVMVPSRNAAALTDSFGRFDLEFQEPPGAPVELVILAPGYPSRSEPARLGDVQIDLVLPRPGPGP
jgi:hypothetical protein